MASAKTCRVLVAVVASLSLWAGSARAQISGASVNNSGSSCSSGNNGDAFCGSSTQTLTNNGTTLATRYAWNVNADIGALSTRDMAGTAAHHVAFTATAPGGYRLNISTSRAGMVQRNSDVLNCEGQAHISSFTGSSNIALASGTLSIASGLDVGNGTGNNQLTLSGSSAAVINRVSNGVGQSHSLTFTWTGSVRSNSCEAAVRMGQQNGSTTGCAACEYPGSPSRTQSSDGHFVTVTYTSLCGNHVVDAAVSEACDEGSANGTFTSCCNSNCTLKSGGTTCRSSGGPCDVAETCTGSSPACPADGFASTSTVCRAAGGVCDLAENCTGSSPGCPFDFKQPNGTECRASAGVCDPAETCNGSSNTCPANSFSPSTTVCRPSAGVCDVAENCTGGSATCPANGFQSSSTVCRASSGVCDVAESCTGGNAACPADAVQSTASICRPAAGVCDQAESCDGVTKNCPNDSAAGAFVVCRPAAGVCDQAETCDGVNNNCPADAKKTTQCRAAAGVCDLAETCNGTDDDCPADTFAPSTTECRAAAGACDVPENCTGGDAACPADTFAPSTQECRSDTGQCDVAENCTGSSAACPPDGFEPDDMPCDDGNACVVGEACQGGVCTGGVGEVCGACETCIPGTGCEAVPRNDCFLSTEPFRSKLLIKDATPDAIDKVIWKWIRGETVTLADFGDPLATDDYAFCLFDTTGLVMQAAMPAGGTCGTKPCWKALNGKGYKYVDSTGTPDGINKLLLKAGGPGLSKVIMKGKGDNLLMPTLPLTLNVQAEVRSSNGQCWSTIHTATGTVRNDSTQFKSKDGN
jgi:hypothetical protein